MLERGADRWGFLWAEVLQRFRVQTDVLQMDAHPVEVREVH